MSRNILFLSEQYIKDNSFVSENVDPKHIMPMVKPVQDLKIHHLLGSALYKKLQDYVDAQDTTPIPEDYRVLLEDYLQDTLLWYVLAHLPIPLQMKLVNKGVIQQADQFIQVSSSTDRKEFSDECEHFAEWYAQRAIEYLRANTAKYPDYLNPGSGCDTIQPDRTQYRTGIFMGGTAARKERTFRNKYR